jgi:HlyD family secretion protein
MAERVDRGHPLTLLVALAIVGAALAGAFYMMRRAEARLQSVSPDEGLEALPVQVVTAERCDVPRVVEVRGFLSGVQEITVPAEVAGRVTRRPVDNGARVQAGDELLTIDETFFALAVQRGEAELARASAQLGEAQSAVTQMEAQLAAAQAVRTNRADEHVRFVQFLEDGNATQREYDAVYTALQTADADVAAASAALARMIEQRATAEATRTVAQAALDDARARLARCVVVAPIDGVVHRWFVDAGEFAIAGAPLVELIGLDELKMNVAVGGREVPLLDALSEATVTVDAQPDRVYAARLHHVDPKLDPLSKKFQVELRVSNADGALYSGMYGAAVLQCGELTDRILVPREAVFRYFGATHCLVVDATDDGPVAALRKLTVRDVVGRLDELDVAAGLEVGDQVIVTRRRGLRAGSPVQIVEHGAAERESEPRL